MFLLANASSISDFFKGVEKDIWLSGNQGNFEEVIKTCAIVKIATRDFVTKSKKTIIKCLQNLSTKKLS